MSPSPPRLSTYFDLWVHGLTSLRVVYKNAADMCEHARSERRIAEARKASRTAEVSQ